MTIDTLFIDGYFSALLENANKRVHLTDQKKKSAFS